MTQNKERNADFHTVTVRFYDTALQERLRKTYLESDNESKSNFLIELIEQSLQNDEAFSKRQAEIISSNNEIAKQLAVLANRMDVLENTVFTQFNRHSDCLHTLMKLNSSMYHVLLALNDGSFLLREEIDKGWWDYLPERFTKVA